MKRHPTHEVRLILMGTLLGVSLPITIATLVENYSFSNLLVTAAVTVNALNFFHGKVVTADSAQYIRALRLRPGFALLDYALNLALVFAFVSIALGMQSAATLAVTNVALRAIDVALVLTVQLAVEGGAIYRCQRFWLWMNAIGILLFGYLSSELFFQIPGLTSVTHELVAYVYATYIAIDIVLDYTVNRGLYFGVPGGWDDLAILWDEHQGEFGDLYRRHLIVAAIEASLPVSRPLRVLDIGCGNGCVARRIATDNIAVVAIDSSPTMIDLARSYQSTDVTYEVADVMGDDVMQGGGFDAAISVFTMQDCESVKRAMAFVARNLAYGANFVMIVENAVGFAIDASHATTERIWIDSSHTVENRRQMIHWRLNSESHEAWTEQDFSETAATLTYWRTADYYRRAALEVGLHLLTHEPLRPRNVATTSEVGLIRRYAAAPRFDLFTFAFRPAPIGQPDAYAALEGV